MAYPVERLIRTLKAAGPPAPHRLRGCLREVRWRRRSGRKEEAEEAHEDGDEEGGSVRAALCVKGPGGTPTEAKERRRDDEAGKANPAVPEKRGSHELLTKKGSWR